MKKVTLLFLQKDGVVLLALKKRGSGSGKWNGVGGKVEDGETIEEATVRECEEEIGVTPSELKKVAEIEFQIPSQQFHNYVYVYTTRQWVGEIMESEEMAPQWFNLADIPYTQMWSDDVLWLPKILAGQQVKASFVLDENESVSHSKVENYNWS